MNFVVEKKTILNIYSFIPIIYMIMISYCIKLTILLSSIFLLLFSCQEQEEKIDIIVEVAPYATENRSVNNTESKHLPDNNSSISMKALTAANIPSNITYQGNLEGILHWQERQKMHIALLTYNFTEKAPNGLLHFYVYSADESQEYTKVLEKEEVILSCKQNSNFEFNKNQFLITDLDNDGHSELWLGYTIICEESKEFSKELCLLYNNQIYKYNASKGKFDNHFSAEILNFAKDLLR